MKNSRFGFVPALAGVIFTLASTAMAQTDATWLQTRPGEQGSACDQGYENPPFFDTDKAPIPASLKKKTLFGNTFISKGYPLYILDTQDKRACILVPLPSGPGTAWVDISLVKIEPVNFSPADWHGRWQPTLKPSLADNSHLPEWVQERLPRQSQGSEGEILISAETLPATATVPSREASAMPARVEISGDKTILSPQTGEKLSDRFEGAGRILGPMLVFDEARSANRAMTSDDCIVLMFMDAPDRLSVYSYGRCGGHGVHYDGAYRRGPIAAKAN